MTRSAMATARSRPAPSRRSQSSLSVPRPDKAPYILSSPGRYETRRRTSRLFRQQSNPATVARPDVGRNNPSKSRIVVVLPEPLGPSSPKTSPRRTSSDNDSSARTRLYDFVKPSVTISSLSSMVTFHSTLVPDDTYRLLYHAIAQANQRLTTLGMPIALYIADYIA